MEKKQPGRILQITYWIAAATIFIWAAWLRWRLPLDPIVDPDLGGYLLPAIHKLTGMDFTHETRNFVYPAFLYFLLGLTNDFRAIPVVQHVLGLIAGALLLLGWQRVRGFVSQSRLPANAHRWLGLFLTTIYLFASEPIHFEMQIRPEGVVAFLAILNIFCALQFTYWFFVRGNRRAAVLSGVATIFSALLLGSAKPTFWFAALASMLPVFCVFVRRGWGIQKILLGLGAAVSVALLILPEHLLARRDAAGALLVPTLLFVGHADIIRDQLARDLDAAAPLPYPREFLQRIRAKFESEFPKSVVASLRRYPSLGFDPEYFIYGAPDSMCATLCNAFHGDLAALGRFYRFYYMRALLHQPLRVAAKVARQITIFYFPKCGAYSLQKSHDLQREYQAGVRVMDGLRVWEISNFAKFQPALESLGRATLLARESHSLGQSGWMNRALSELAKTYFAGLCIALLLAIAVSSRATLTHRLGWLAAAVLFSYAYSFAVCFEIALVNSLDVHRYMTVQVIVALFAQFLALLFILEFTLEIRDRAKTSLPDSAPCKGYYGWGTWVGQWRTYSRSRDAVIRVYDSAGNVIQTHEHTGDFKEW
jgi:hypothetical protein